MTDVGQLQRLILSTRAEHGFTTDPVRIICLLVEEVGEVAAEIKKTWSDNYSDLVLGELSDELADAYVLLSALASAFEIDLEDAVRSKFFGADAARSWATASSTPMPPDGT